MARGALFPNPDQIFKPPDSFLVMHWFFNIQIWVSLLTLTALEIVLGIDNIIFISILAGKLPRGKRTRTRSIGLGFALITRVLLLCLLYWLTGMTKPLVHVYELQFSGKDLVLIFGGLFLIAKSTREVHESMEAGDHDAKPETGAMDSVVSVIIQIVLLDIVFSIDSVITAVGMAQQIGVMIAAVVIAMCVMLWSAGAVGDFVNKNPTIKMLALSFLLLIGAVLVADGFGHHLPRGYIYFALAYSFAVELLNMKIRARRKHSEAIRRQTRS